MQKIRQQHKIRQQAKPKAKLQGSNMATGDGDDGDGGAGGAGGGDGGACGGGLVVWCWWW